MDPLKVLHVYKDYYPILGGIENHIKTLAEAQVKAGYQVRVLVTNPGGQPSRAILNGVMVQRAWRFTTIASTPISPEFPLALAKLKPDITHLHFPYPIGEISQWLFGKGRLYVITYHCDVVRQKMILRFYSPVLWRILRGAARIVPTSDRYIETSPYLSQLRDRCTVVPLSVDPGFFQNQKPLIPPVEIPTLLFVGRHRYYKGLDTLLQAMTRLEARLLVGGDGPMRARWQQQAIELGISDRTQFLGNVSDDDLPRLYASADVFVLPANARAEAFGKVLLEAMSAGLPCVTTEVGTGTSFVVRDGITGYVVPPENPDALVFALQKLLSDPALRTKMGHAGRERVQKEFTVEQMLSRVDAIYRKVLSAGNSKSPKPSLTIEQDL